MTAPTIGRIVHYTLSEYDVTAINQRRKAARAALTSADFPSPMMGNTVEAGQTYPAQIVRVFGGPSVNLKVALDGYDEHWATSRSEGESGEHGKWTWPALAPAAPKPSTTAADPRAEAARLLQLAEKAAGTDVSNQLAAIADRWLAIANQR